MEDNKLLHKIELAVLTLENSLPESAWMTSSAKIPHKVIVWREVLFYRGTELARVAYDLYIAKKYTSSILLIRALMEVAAFMFWLQKRLHNAVKKQELGNIDEFLMRGILGGRDASAPKESYQVLRAIDEITKEVDIFRSDYEWLSEFAHPNSLGTHESYAKIEEKKFTVHFGWYLNGLEGSHVLPIFHYTLELFIGYYDQIAEFIEDFQKLCEEDLER